MRSLAFVVLAALHAAAVPLAAQHADTGGGGADAARAVRVAIVGASVSAGFVDGPLTGGSTENSTVPLKALLGDWLASVDADVSSTAEAMMFTQPQAIGKQQLDRVLRGDEPSLVLAIDFLFWYGYGRVADPAKSTEARLQRLEEGIAQLERIDAPLLVGNLPDMRGAARRMLSPAQIPSEADLQRLNDRIAAWAKDRATVRVFDLRTLVAQMKEKGVELPCAAGTVTAPPGSMLQGDKLHANRLGMAYLGFLLQPELRALWGGREPELPQWTFDEFVTAAGAELEVGDLKKAGARQGAEEPAGTGR